MAQITTIDANEFSNSAEFIPIRGFSNCHLQTTLPRLFCRKMKLTPYWQWLGLPDGDFVDLTWSKVPAQVRRRPRLVVFHGLEGNLSSPCIHGLVEMTQKRGWLGVVMYFRGHSGESNRVHRIYHSGGTEDASWSLYWLQRRSGHAPTTAVGYPLDGNMPACLLAKENNDLPVDAATIVSALFMLEAYNYHIEKGFSHVYQRYLLNPLKVNAARKLAAYPGTLPIGLAWLKSVRRIREFDDLITARIRGYADAIDYYRQCSAMPMLNRIAKPMLTIHARDGPFMDHQVISKPESLPSQMKYQLAEHGGRVGFIGGALLHPQTWLESRIPDQLATYLEAKSC